MDRMDAVALGLVKWGVVKTPSAVLWLLLCVNFGHPPNNHKVQP